MHTYQSPEITVLCMACELYANEEKKAELSHFLSKNSIDWPLLYQLADRHRLKPFLFQALQKSSGCSTGFLTSLQDDCREAATDNLLKLHHYHSVDKLLTENGIDHIALKGIYLAENCYPDSSLRSTGDIDLLINKDDVFKTTQLFQQHGYQLNKKHTIHWQHKKETVLSDLFEVSLFKPFFGNNAFEIDLHWRILGFNIYYILFDLSFIRSNPEISNERIIVLLVAHHGVLNVWQRIYFINDLYFLLKSKPVNWDRLLNELDSFGFKEAFLAGLYWCRTIWGLTLPPPIESLIKSRHVQSMAAAYAKSWKNRQEDEKSYLIVKQFLLFFKSQMNLNGKLKVLFSFIKSRIFRYSLFKVRNTYIYLPKEFGFITVFIRAYQSLLRFLPAKSSSLDAKSDAGNDYNLVSNESSHRAK
ncbi:nucleotidyltransferase domain-containing protein [Spirosoma aerolatum]|uniref:nucleotidyltransferase domain-containing protein n=1 Tax=Spirosoma aerolatum TaxID=1211326 RepID=UPI0009AE3EE2|nr:nucleotidyltransferase family protein [Spirosoma aerolatum]